MLTFVCWSKLASTWRRQLRASEELEHLSKYLSQETNKHEIHTQSGWQPWKKFATRAENGDQKKKTLFIIWRTSGIWSSNAYWDGRNVELVIAARKRGGCVLPSFAITCWRTDPAPIITIIWRRGESERIRLTGRFSPDGDLRRISTEFGNLTYSWSWTKAHNHGTSNLRGSAPIEERTVGRLPGKISNQFTEWWDS
jgi:hypothetical protein